MTGTVVETVVEWPAVGEEQGGWVEIELERSDRSRRRDTRSGPASSGDMPARQRPFPDVPDSLPPTEGLRRLDRSVVAAIAVGALLIGALVGWTASRSGDGRAEVTDDRGDASSPSGAVEESQNSVVASPMSLPEIPVPPVSLIVDDAVAESSAATVVPASTTEAALEEPIVERLGIPASLAGAGLQLVGLGTSGDLVEIDVDAGTIRIVDTGRSAPSAIGQNAMIVGRDWTLVPPVDIFEYDARSPSDGVRVRRGGPTEMLPSVLAPLYVLSRGPDDTVWKWDETSQWTGRTTASLYDVDGNVVVAAIDVPGFPGGSDAAGALISVATGGTYRTTVDGVTRLTAGDLLAIGPQFIVARECDESFACAILRVEPATEERIEVPSTNETDSLLGGLYFSPGSTDGRTVSPDGRHAVVTSQSDPGVLESAILDLGTGATTPLPTRDPFTGGSILWGNDGHSVVFVDRTSRVVSFDLETMEAQELDGWPRLSQLSVRPTD